MNSPDVDSRDLTLLDPAFAAKVAAVVSACAVRKVQLIPFFTLRGPAVQARLYCQSRSITEIAAKRTQMAGAPKLAALLLDEYAARGLWATDAAPGESWHQYGTACDCFIERAGKAVWSSPLYKSVYAAVAVEQGLTAGANWRRADSDHIQSSALASPLDVAGATWAGIEKQMEDLYGI